MLPIELTDTEARQLLMMVLDRIESVESFIGFDAIAGLPAPLSHSTELAVLAAVREKLAASAGPGGGDDMELCRISFVRQPEPATLAAHRRPSR